MTECFFRIQEWILAEQNFPNATIQDQDQLNSKYMKKVEVVKIIYKNRIYKY